MSSTNTELSELGVTVPQGDKPLQVGGRFCNYAILRSRRNLSRNPMLNLTLEEHAERVRIEAEKEEQNGF